MIIPTIQQTRDPSPLSEGYFKLPKLGFLTFQTFDNMCLFNYVPLQIINP